MSNKVIAINPKYQAGLDFYIIGHTHWGMAKWGLNQAREKYRLCQVSHEKGGSQASSDA